MLIVLTAIVLTTLEADFNVLKQSKMNYLAPDGTQGLRKLPKIFSKVPELIYGLKFI